MSLPPLPFKVKAKVSWAGEEPGDLGFLENELIQVFSIVDESWWSGKLRRNGAEGIFPKDYVEIIEQYSLPNSSSNLASSLAAKQDYRSNGIGAPSKQHSEGSLLNYMSGSYNNSSMSYPFEKQKQQGLDGYSELVRASNGTDPTQIKPTYPEQEELLKQRELEIQILKQQQQQQLQLQQQQQQQQQEHYQESGNALASKQFSHLPLQSSHHHHYHHDNGRMKHSYSQQASPYSNVLSYEQKTGSLDDFRRKVAPDQKGDMFENNKANHFSLAPPAISSKQKQRRVPKEQEILKEYEEIARKRAQLELELQKLKNNVNLKTSSSPNRQQKDNFSIDSYGTHSDDWKRRDRSRDDLSKKLSKFVSDEDDEEINGDGNNTNTMFNYLSQERSGLRTESPPPPAPPKHGLVESVPVSPSRIPFNSDDFKVSSDRNVIIDEENYQRLFIQHEELKNSIKSLQSDVMNLSELSATSAGSFLKHKYERELKESQLRLKNMAIGEPEKETESPTIELKSNVMDSVFEDKKKNGGIFKKILRRSTQEELNPIERKFQQQDEIDMATYKLDVNRMNSLTSQEKQGRTKRVVRNEGNLVVKPLEYISEINANETIGAKEVDEIDLDSIAYKKVEAFVAKYSITFDLNDFISDLSIKFRQSDLNKVRCILLHLAKIRIIEESSSSISQVKPKLMEVQLKGEATIFQINYIFKKMLDALRIPSEIVLGFWKKPNEFYHNESYVINHCWLSILVDNNFRLIDIYNFINPSVCNLQNCKYNEFYFLSQPLSLVSTHIPSIIDLQHVMPPIDPSIAFYLPRTYSGFYGNRIQFTNFNNALTRLNDLEVFELELLLPKDVELFTLVKTSKVTTNDLSLCQVKWVNHKRVAKIKAILPENESIGVLQIFAGAKGLQKHFDNIHELSIVIPLMHEGQSKQTKFVQRYPTVQSQNNDLYIVKPQTNKLITKNSYTFEIEQYPSQGIDARSMQMVQDFKIVIESPSGKYFKLTKEELGVGSCITKPYGVYSCNIKCQEAGAYRGLVIGDSGNSWYVFAQWESVSVN
ncbi:hypothetical protein KGF56_002866 [Candida oxycetoniae]|uniref:SH3 domain-containing protein n=1 Tax=Candida oxycetoniae TaxID=497107 RepID=A0AAI9SWE1_9ASCO|nr:uncharacterized protein KGF56_002866 [Candida oxycetoniae]KAI3404346.2 hypothetical protein KGF56_002866 [Candida oxycetoniae]